MFGFVDTSRQKPRSFVDAPYASVSAATSIGSPTAVPVPWASNSWMSRADNPATASASLTTSACPSTLGAR